MLGPSLTEDPSRRNATSVKLGNADKIALASPKSSIDI